MKKKKQKSKKEKITPSFITICIAIYFTFGIAVGIRSFFSEDWFKNDPFGERLFWSATTVVLWPFTGNDISSDPFMYY